MKNIFGGTILVIIGIICGLNAFGVTNINLLFDGWWTLFLIVPCAYGLVRKREITGNVVGLLLGVLLLLTCQNVISWEQFGKLLFPAVLLAVGVRQILVGIRKKRTAKNAETEEETKK